MIPVKLNNHYYSINNDNVVEKNDFVEEFRSPQSDIEIPKTRKRERVSGIDEGTTDTNNAEIESADFNSVNEVKITYTNFCGNPLTPA